MAEALIDVTGIGNAIVDVLAHADEALPREHGLTRARWR